MDKETVKTLQALLSDGRYRNQSHVIEYAVTEFLKGIKMNYQHKYEL